ncbi:MAG: hypothetical protein IJJ57_02510, partial [Ruminococcus sp.]|nr:hypothetical protein [Ruminococcus sp.]
LPNDTKEGTDFTFNAQFDDVKTEEHTLTYSKSEPVIKSIKLCVSPSEGDVDVTSAFTGLDTPVIRTRRNEDMRFTLDITNSDKIGKVIMVGLYGNVRATINGHYDEESGLWIAEGNYSTWIADELHDFNVLIVPKEDVENGVDINYSNTYYSHPSGIIFSYGSNGLVYDKDTAHPITGAELTLVGIDKDGKEYTCDMTKYGQKAHTYSDEHGEYVWSIPYGDWKVVCKADGYEPSESRWFTIPIDGSVYSFDLSKPYQEQPPMTITSPVTTSKPVTTTVTVATTAVPSTTKNSASTTAPVSTAKPAASTSVVTTVNSGVSTTVSVPVSTTVPKADGGFSADEIAASPVKPLASLSKLVLPADSAGDTVTVYYTLSGCEGEYSTFATHFRMDSRLEIPVDENSGKLSIKKGSALENCPALNTGKYAKPDEGWNEYYLMDVESDNTGTDGVIAEITVKIPENAKPGDVYPIDINYRPGDRFTSIVSPEDRAALMQAYFFTNGIYNEDYNSQFKASADDIKNVSKLAELPLYCDGYIAIEDTAETPAVTTSATKPVTTAVKTTAKPSTTTKAATQPVTSTASKPATTTNKPVTTTNKPVTTTNKPTTTSTSTTTTT